MSALYLVKSSESHAHPRFFHSIPFSDGTEKTSFPEHEKYKLERCEQLKVEPGWPISDAQPTWIVYHLEYPKTDTSANLRQPCWSPVYAFVQQTVSYNDFAVYNHYNSTHPAATFVNFFVATQLRKDGTRLTLSFSEKAASGNANGHAGKRMAKLAVSGGAVAKPGKEADLKQPRDVQYIEMKVGQIKEVLEREFGFRF